MLVYDFAHTTLRMGEFGIEQSITAKLTNAFCYMWYDWATAWLENYGPVAVAHSQIII